MEILQYAPGQRVSIVYESLNDTGTRFDGYDAPIVSRIVFPDLSLADDYPVYMTKLDVGLYFYQFTLPLGAAAVGSYLVDISYQSVEGTYKSVIYQVVVNAPYGNFSASPS